MSEFIINPNTISFEQAKKDIVAYIQSKPDAASWKDFFDGSAGQILIELLAGHSTFLSYQTILARREAFLRYAENRSSVVGIAQNLGYSVFRGTNARVKISITPISTQTLNRFDVIGSVLDTDLIVLDTAYLIAGVPTTINCTIGTVKSESKTALSDTPYVFRFEQPKISEDISVFLNGNIVSTSSTIIDARDQKFVIQSNPIESVDIFYLNDEGFTVRYNTGDILSINYVEIYQTNFTAADVQLDLGGVYTTTIESAYVDQEDKESIRNNAPLYHETQFVVKAREDYHKLLKLLDTSIIETGYKDISPMVVELFYIKDDLTLLSETEENELLEKLITYRSMGLEPPTFGETIRNNVELDILVKITSANPLLINDINTILSQFEKTLRTKLDFEQVENLIESLDTVRIARITIGSNPWSANSPIEVGTFVNNGDIAIVHRAERIIYKSGTIEPVWPTVIGNTIIDGRIIWSCKYLENQCDPFNPLLPLIPPRDTWEQETDYKVGDIVIPTTLDIYEYVVIGVINKSDIIEPTWTALAGGTPEDKKGELVSDNQVIWMAVPQIGTPSAWTANTIYNKGDVVIATNQEDSDTEGLMFQVISYQGKTGSSSPVFPTALDITTIDNDILWRSYDKNSSPDTLARNEYYILTNNITITTT